jgi:hypothetical protein
VLGELSPPVRAAVQDAQPIALEDGVIVFGVAPNRRDAINERLRKSADTIKDGFAARLGSAPRFSLRAHDFDTHDALAPPAAAEPPPEPEPEAENEHEHIDLEELVDAPDTPPDSITRLTSQLGAEVVEEIPREGSR